MAEEEYIYVVCNKGEEDEVRTIFTGDSSFRLVPVKKIKKEDLEEWKLTQSNKKSLTGY